MMQTPSHVSGNPQAKQWVNLPSPNATGFTPDEQIEHFNQWKGVAIKEHMTLVKRNMDVVIKTVESVIKGLEEKNFKVLDAYIRNDLSMHFGALILVDEDSFLSEEFDSAYKMSRPLLEKINDSILHLDISFASKTEDTDEGAIACDGYTIKRENINEPKA